MTKKKPIDTLSFLLPLEGTTSFRGMDIEVREAETGKLPKINDRISAEEFYLMGDDPRLLMLSIDAVVSHCIELGVQALNVFHRGAIRKMDDKQPYTVIVGFVYRKDGFYYTFQGIQGSTDFLNVSKLN